LSITEFNYPSTPLNHQFIFKPIAGFFQAKLNGRLDDIRHLSSAGTMVRDVPAQKVGEKVTVLARALSLWKARVASQASLSV
jgi:hypothetical protein